MTEKGDSFPTNASSEGHGYSICTDVVHRRGKGLTKPSDAADSLKTRPQNQLLHETAKWREDSRK